MAQNGASNGANGGSPHNGSEDDTIVEVIQQVRDGDTDIESVGQMEQAPRPEQAHGDTVIPLFTETATVTKRWRRTGTVKVHRKVRENEVLIEEALARHDAMVERRQVGTVHQEMPQVRMEGETLVVPVVEEVIVTRRDYLLKEEVRITTHRTSSVHREKLRTREHYVDVEREGSAAAREVAMTKPTASSDAMDLAQRATGVWLALAWPWGYWIGRRDR